MTNNTTKKQQERFDKIKEAGIKFADENNMKIKVNDSSSLIIIGFEESDFGISLCRNRVSFRFWGSVLSIPIMKIKKLTWADNSFRVNDMVFGGEY